MDLKLPPLEVLEVIYDLLESESESDMLVFLIAILSFFGENSYATIIFPVQLSTAAKIYCTWRRSPNCHDTDEKKNFPSTKICFIKHLLNPT